MKGGREKENEGERERLIEIRLRENEIEADRIKSLKGCFKCCVSVMLHTFF